MTDIEIICRTIDNGFDSCLVAVCFIALCSAVSFMAGKVIQFYKE